MRGWEATVTSAGKRGILTEEWTDQNTIEEEPDLNLREEQGSQSREHGRGHPRKELSCTTGATRKNSKMCLGN